MSDAQKLMADAVFEHGWNDAPGSRLHGFCDCGHDKAQDGPDYYPYDRGDHSAHVAAEIDKALGGLTRQWTVRYRDGDVTMRPSPGTPTERAIEIAQQHLEDREIVVGWVSGWSAP